MGQTCFKNCYKIYAMPRQLAGILALTTSNVRQWHQIFLSLMTFVYEACQTPVGLKQPSWDSPTGDSQISHIRIQKIMGSACRSNAHTPNKEIFNFHPNRIKPRSKGKWKTSPNVESTSTLCRLNWLLIPNCYVGGTQSHFLAAY